MRRHTSEYTTPTRSRFVEYWDRLPPLTVLVAMPGWGKAEWVRQCAARLAAVAPQVGRRWVNERPALDRLLTATPSTASVHFVHDVAIPPTDPLWHTMLEYLERHPDQRLVVATLDVPLLPDGAPATVLDERHLALTTAELQHLTDESGVEFPPELRGCPYLVHQHRQRIEEERSGDPWRARVSAEVELFRLWEKSPEPVEESVLRRSLHAARYLRRIAHDTLPRLDSSWQSG